MVGIAGNTVKNLRKIGRLDREMHSKRSDFFENNLFGNLERDNYFNDAKESFKI